MSRTLRRYWIAVAIAVGVGCMGAAQGQDAPAPPASTPVTHAHTPATVTQRDVNQQQRIESGLQSGALTTHEAGRLEHGEQVIDRTQQRALANGTLGAGEQSRITSEQNAESRDITGLEQNGRTGNANTRSSERMQADVARDADQQRRIHNGVSSGSLTHREAGHLEGRQAHGADVLSVAARNGRTGAREQAAVGRTDRADSRRIHRDQHHGRRRH